MKATHALSVQVYIYAFLSVKEFYTVAKHNILYQHYIITPR